jgi:hypothetical protein
MGTIGGAPVAVTWAVAAIKTDQFVSIDLTNETDACNTIVNGGGFPRGATVLQLNVALPGNQTGLPAPGAYTIDTTGTLPVQANAEFLSLSSTSCTVLASAAPNMSIGTITLATVTPTQVSGSFDVTFGENADGGVRFDHVTGQFSAQGCPLRSPGPDPSKCGGFVTQ